MSGHEGPLRSAAGIVVGDSLGRLERTPTRLGLFLYGVAHWTAHRTHYDVEWARQEGMPDVIVTAQLMSAWQIELLAAWAGSYGALRRLQERNVGPAYAGETLVITGEVTSIAVAESRPGRVEVGGALRVLVGDRRVVEATAVLELPAGSASAGSRS